MGMVFKKRPGKLPSLLNIINNESADSS